MLPIYEAQSFIRRIEKGGRTKPLIISVLVDGKPVPYVVKLYTKKEVSESYVVAKEVFTSVLADSFDLQRPLPALIYFSGHFLKSLPQDVLQVIEERDKRLKFGCLYLDGTFTFSAELHKDTLERYTEIDTIYAFDNLVRNVDRRIDKSNILLAGTDTFLIDHEYSLYLKDSTIQELDSQNWIYPKERHIFYNFLKHHSKERKAKYFETFEHYLSMLNPEVLNLYADQLQEHKHPIGNFELLKKYMYYMKENCGKFVTLLRGQLQ